VDDPRRAAARQARVKEKEESMQNQQAGLTPIGE
jgi:hypothetical protein